MTRSLRILIHHCVFLIPLSVAGQADTLIRYLHDQSRQYIHQPDSMQYATASKQWPGVEKHFALYDWYINEIRFKSPIDTAMLQLQQAYQVFLDHNETDLARLVWILQFIYQLHHGSYESIDAVYADIAAHQREATEKGWPDKVWEVEFLSGRKRFEINDYGVGMELMLHAYDNMQQHGWSSPVIAVVLHQLIANSFYKFGDMENCIRYHQAGQQFPVPQTSAAYDYQNLNTIGLCHSRRMRYDSAVWYMTRSMKLAELNKDSFWISLMYGNIGNILFKQGDHQQAKRYLERDYHGSIKANAFGSAANAAMLLATIALQAGNVNEAEEYIRFSKTHKDTFDLESMSQYLAGQYMYHKLKGDLPMALAYADSLQAVEKRKALVLDKRILDQADIRVQIAQYESEVKVLEAARNRQVLMRNGLVIILLLASLIAVLWINRSIRSRRAAMERLSQAQLELGRYTRTLLEKNELIQRFREEAEHIKALGIPDADRRTANIQTMIHTSILTDEDWRHFRDLFDTVHPGFLVRLREKFNDLTPAETRLLALTKLQIPVKDMADILGISPDSIRKTRYRLRKKIGMPEDGSLDELIAFI